MKFSLKIIFVIISIISVSVFGYWRYQSDQTTLKPEIFSKNGIALEGYDVVSFFDNSNPILGNKEFSYIYKAVEWRFANQENLSKFKNNPKSFLPEYGGYCAYGTSNAYKAPTDIETWTLYDGKLYLNYNPSVKKQWLKYQDSYIVKANKNWKKIKHKK